MPLSESKLSQGASPEVVGEGSPLFPDDSNLDIPDSAIKEALTRSFLKQFRLFVTSLIVLDCWLILTEVVSYRAGKPHFLWDLFFTLLVFTAIRVASARPSLPAIWLHVFGVAMVATMMADSIHVALTQDAPPPSVLIVFVLVVSGSLFVSFPLFVVSTIAAMASWFLMVGPRLTPSGWDEHIAVSVLFAVLSGLLLFYRVRTQTHIEKLRLRDKKYRQELTEALEVAHAQIAEKKQSEIALKNSEERYRQVIERSPVAIVLHDNRRLLLANQEAARLIGLTDPEDVIGMKLDDIIHRDSMELAKKGAEHLRTRSEPMPPIDIRLNGVDGEIREVEMTAQNVIFDGKSVIQVVLQNVTERRIAERALRESEERYRLLAENITDGIWTSDLNFQFTYLSPSVASIFKFPVDLAIKLPVERMMIEDSLKHAMTVVGEMVEEAKEKGPNQPTERMLELEFRRGDGKTVWTEIKARILFDADGAPSALLGVTRDITERRRSDEELRQSEERFRLLAEHATDVIFTCDLQLQMTFLSPAATRLFGYPLAEVLEMRADVLIAPSSLEIATNSLREELQLELDPTSDRYRSRTFELEYLTQGGGTVWTEVRVSFLRDEDGTPTGLVGVIRDISERRAAEAERKNLEGQLVQAQKLEAIGTLAGGIAHDFNNLLTGILGYAELLKLEAKEGDVVFESADVIQTAATRARELTRQLLGFARKGKHQNSAVDLNRIVSEVIALMSRTTNKNIGIESVLAPEAATLLGDSAQIQQVVLNLAINAKDAMPDGGTLTFETRIGILDQAMRLKYPEATDGKFVTVVVSDTGGGIPPELMDRVFEPFFTTKETGKGTGLGLAMVYGIAKNHEGFVDLRSEMGKGTSFTLSFPAFEAVQPITASQSATS